ncbi:uncharacterized protein LOC143010364 isoform X3 [Genypterus blacodes]|uniref:uncharacterized protein LOC143010364 isoform X3 n=1 Tax=Genypterus blacodes TaxID=154954 RepID=UPI003F76BCA6
MASLTLQPFLAVPRQIPPVPWTSWISLFESYAARSRCAEKVDLLMRFLGAGGRRVLWSLPGPTGTYEAMVAALSGHYQAREDAEKAREDGHKAGGEKDKAREDAEKAREDGHKAREGIDKAREDTEKAWVDRHKAGGDKDKAREDRHKAREDAEKAREDGHKAREGIDKAREDAEKAWVDGHKAGGDKDKAHAEKVKKIIIVSATVGTALLTGIGAVVAAPFVLAGVGFASGGIVAGAAVGGAVGGATAGVITSLNSTSDDKKEPGEEDKDADPKKQS